MRATLDKDGWGFETDIAHYEHDGHYGKTEKQLKGDVADIVCAINSHNAIHSVYSTFSHLDGVLRKCATADDPIHKTAAALWEAIAKANDKGEAQPSAKKL